MGSINSEIKIGMELRSCEIVTKDKAEKALFHMWENYSNVVDASLAIGGHPGGQVSQVLAIVEKENGEVMRIEPYRIRFTDNKIKEFAFE